MVARLNILLILCLSLAGCCARQPCITWLNAPENDPAIGLCRNLVAGIEYPDVARAEPTGDLQSGPPRTMSHGIPTEFWDLTLDDAIRMGLQDSKVLKQLGGQVLDVPAAARTIFDPSITMTNPRFGEEAALAAFDAQLASSFRYVDGSRAFNNIAAGGGALEVTQDQFLARHEIAKTAATGTRFSLRHNVGHTNNDLGLNVNRFHNVWTGGWEATARQPLLQGAGVAFNRIAGPNGTIDFNVTRGVILARIDGDISLAVFERGVRNYVRDVETAYWQLYFAYRNLEANRIARDTARDTWQAVRARFEADMRRGEADQEAQSREQLYFFEQQVLLALNGGNLLVSTPGVYDAERGLRRLIGLAMNDGNLIRPADEPTEARVVFDWDGCVADALTRRVELREQMWRVRQKELELLAARNFLLPRLDALATYRVAGVGDDLIGGTAPFSSLARELASFGNDEVELGLQLSVPLGYRREFAGVRHAELNLQRDREILRDQEEQVLFDLSNALASLETTHENNRLSYNRVIAAQQVVDARSASFEAGRMTIQFLLDAQRRLAEAQINYFRNRINHALALRDVHLNKGTLLAYDGVELGEGAWCRPATCLLADELKHWKGRRVPRHCMQPNHISAGPFDGAIDGTGMLPTEAELPQPQMPAPAPEPADVVPEEVPPLPNVFELAPPDIELLPDPASEATVPLEVPEPPRYYQFRKT